MIVVLMYLVGIVSGTLDNTWVWTPAAGDPTRYILNKVEVGEDIWQVVDGNISPDTITYPNDGPIEELRGKEIVRYVVSSAKDESYQVRVRAGKGEKLGAWSEVSERLDIDTAPGKPFLMME